ncbi:MAG: Ig domain-containing protein, partial [Acidimicrobiales bacterium]
MIRVLLSRIPKRLAGTWLRLPFLALLAETSAELHNHVSGRRDSRKGGSGTDSNVGGACSTASKRRRTLHSRLHPISLKSSRVVFLVVAALVIPIGMFVSLTAKPGVAAASLSTLGITTSSLPAATIGQPYHAQIAATGGTAPYGFSLAEGVLPAGLTLASDGVVSGIPTEISVGAVVVAVEDATGNTATKPLSFSVVADPPAQGWSGLPQLSWGKPQMVDTTPLYDAVFNSVSCPTATFCVAVGVYESGGSETAVAASWQGANSPGWQYQELPLEGYSSELMSVSCPTTTFCQAVGGINQQTTSPAGLVLDYSGGGSWESESLSATSNVDRLLSVSCTSTNFCLAVGQSAGNAVSAVFVNGNWTEEPVPTGISPVLESVSCISTSPVFCQAVGPDSSTNTLVALSFSGTSWASPGTSIPARKLSSGISCLPPSSSSPPFCIIVANTSSEPSSFLWHGVDWTSDAMPSSTGYQVIGVSCASPTYCVAVGSVVSSAGTQPIGYSWNGSAWTSTVLQGISGAATAISCVSTSFCDGVGALGSSTQYYPGAASWNGTTWTVQNVLPPILLTSISCPSSSFCMVVGENLMPSLQPIAYSWNGSTWTSTPFSSSSPGETLEGVSCPSPSFCMAAGSSLPGPVAYAWNGSTWTRQTFPTSS